ncbi:MAG: hypothetical protein AAB638_00870 [Patescibacteria group bacterium]
MITTHERWLIVYVKDRVFLTPLTLATHRKYEAELKTNVRSLGGPGRYDIFGGIVEVKQTCMKKEKKIKLDQLIKLSDSLRQLGCDNEIMYHLSAAIHLLTNELNK